MTHSYDINLLTNKTSIQSMQQHKGATRIFDYTTISGRLRTFSWGDRNRQTGRCNQIYDGPNFSHSPQEIKCNEKAQYFQIFLYSAQKLHIPWQM